MATQTSDRWSLRHEPEPNTENDWTPQALRPVTGHGHGFGVVPVTRHQHKIQMLSLGKCRDQSIPHVDADGSTEQRHGRLLSVATDRSVTGRKTLFLEGVLKKEANRFCVVQQCGTQQLVRAEFNVRCRDWQVTGDVVARRPRPSDGEAVLTMPAQLLGQLMAGEPLVDPITDQDDRHRPRRTLESQPKPTRPSRIRRNRLRVW